MRYIHFALKYLNGNQFVIVFIFFSIIFNLYNLFDKVISVLFSFKVLIAFECNNTITSHNWGKWGFDYILTVTIVEEFGN